MRKETAAEIAELATQKGVACAVNCTLYSKISAMRKTTPELHEDGDTVFKNRM